MLNGVKLKPVREVSFGRKSGCLFNIGDREDRGDDLFQMSPGSLTSYSEQWFERLHIIMYMYIDTALLDCFQVACFQCFECTLLHTTFPFVCI